MAPNRSITSYKPKEDPESLKAISERIEARQDPNRDNPCFCTREIYNNKHHFYCLGRVSTTSLQRISERTKPILMSIKSKHLKQPSCSEEEQSWPLLISAVRSRDSRVQNRHKRNYLIFDRTATLWRSNKPFLSQRLEK